MTEAVKKNGENASFAEIGAVLRAAKTVCIYPHIHMDGDAAGSAAALCRSLRLMGKDCVVLVEDDLPGNLRFLDRGYCTKDLQKGVGADVSLCLDCGHEGRFPKRADTFRTGKVSVCIDHHQTATPFCMYDHVEPDASSTGELIYQLLVAMEAAHDAETAEALFAAITTDTGNFQHSSTNRKCHEIVAALYDWGLDCNKVSRALYDHVRLQKIRLQNLAMSRMEILSGGLAAMAVIDQAMLRETGAFLDEGEGLVDQLRSIDGVEVGILVKEDRVGQCRASLRAKSWADVSAIAGRLGGGGHVKAAGCTVQMPLAEALTAIKKAVTEELALQRPEERPEASAAAAGEDGRKSGEAQA